MSQSQRNAASFIEGFKPYLDTILALKIKRQEQRDRLREELAKENRGLINEGKLTETPTVTGPRLPDNKLSLIPGWAQQPHTFQQQGTTEYNGRQYMPTPRPTFDPSLLTKYPGVDVSAKTDEFGRVSSMGYEPKKPVTPTYLVDTSGKVSGKVEGRVSRAPLPRVAGSGTNKDSFVSEKANLDNDAAAQVYAARTNGEYANFLKSEPSKPFFWQGEDKQVEYEQKLQEFEAQAKSIYDSEYQKEFDRLQSVAAIKAPRDGGSAEQAEGGKVKVKNSSGQVGYIPESQLSDALSQGYTRVK